MTRLRIILFLEFVNLLGYCCFGKNEDNGVVLGMRAPASISTMADFPKYSTGLNIFDPLRILPKDSMITSLTSDPKGNVLFAAINDAIYILSNFSIQHNGSGNLTAVYRGTFATIGQIAFDFVSNNLYWCDSEHRWIAMKPAYNLNLTSYKIVVHDGLNKPEGMALDPENRLMFFSEMNWNARIEKASLDGLNRVVIVHRGLTKVPSLTVDTVNNKLYWADEGRQTLEGCDYDGSNRRVIKRTNSISLRSVIYHQNMLYAVNNKDPLIISVDVFSESLTYTGNLPPGKPLSITVYDKDNVKSIHDPCFALKCHHLCVTTKSAPKCFCFEGFDLDRNGKTCTDRFGSFGRMILVSNGSSIASHEIHSADSQTNTPHSVWLPVKNINIETFNVDSKSKFIYFVDGNSRSLKKYEIISRRLRTLTSTSSATDLTFDWIANLLGWIEPIYSSIRCFSLYSQSTAAIYSSLENPAYLTVDPHHGTLYWISGTLERSIMRGSWTRDTPRILISSANLHNPSSLQYDVTSHRIYWLQSLVIKSSTTTGLDIRSHISTHGASKAFVYKGFFGWLNADKIFFARKIATSAEYVVETVQNATDVVVTDSSVQMDKRGTCHILNGGCGGICVPEENGRRCECDIGLQLQPDNSCDNDLFMDEFMLVTDYSHGRILQIGLHAGNVVQLPVTKAGATGLAFDKSTMTLFYSETLMNTITSTTLHGKSTELFYATGFVHADRLAIDYSTGNLYYTAVGKENIQGYIGAVHRKTHLHKTLINDLQSPRDIALYPSKGLLFWTEFGNVTEIGRAHMDGTSKTYIATQQIGWPNGLTIDFASQRLYWTDGKLNCIESSDLNGGNRRILLSDSDAHLMGIVSHGQFLFYTAWNRQHVVKIDKKTGLKIPFMSDHPELGRLDSLEIYADEFRDVSTSCSKGNGYCSLFCFPTPTGRTCGCQDNINLQSDKLTCEGEYVRDDMNNFYVKVIAGCLVIIVVVGLGFLVYQMKKTDTAKKDD